MPDNNLSDRFDDVACPFCGLACDDLSPRLSNGVLDVDSLVCEKARAGFSAALKESTLGPMVKGEPSSLENALDHAARLLQDANLPLISGLVGDLADSQAGLSLAEHCGGVIDHQDGDALATAQGVYQETGWMSTSLGEVRNRADLIVTLGDNIEQDFPRWREKIIDVTDRLHTEQAPKQIELSNDALRILSEARALYHDKPLVDVDTKSSDLYSAVKNAKYAVFVIADINADDADLVWLAVAGMVRDINEKGRAALLPLGANNGSTSAQLGAAWQTGFGLRTSFASGGPVQDWRGNAGNRLLDEGAADVMVWINSLWNTPLPPCNVPTIVFGHPAMPLSTAPEVFIPVSVPGVQRAGFIHRGDGLRLVPLRELRPSDLPDSRTLAAELISRIPRSLP